MSLEKYKDSSILMVRENRNGSITGIPRLKHFKRSPSGEIQMGWISFKTMNDHISVILEGKNQDAYDIIINKEFVEITSRKYEKSIMFSTWEKPILILTRTNVGSLFLNRTQTLLKKYLRSPLKISVKSILKLILMRILI